MANSLAISYHMKRRGKEPMKCAHGMSDCPECYAGGGEANEKGVHQPILKGNGMSSAGAGARTQMRAKRGEAVSPKAVAAMTIHTKNEHERVLGELKSMPNPKLPLAEGGDVDENDLVDRIIARRMAEGGDVKKETYGGNHVEDNDHGEGYTSKVAGPKHASIYKNKKWIDTANPQDISRRIKEHKAGKFAEGGDVDEEPTADFMSNDFDYLDQEDEDQNDIVSRIMARRKKA